MGPFFREKTVPWQNTSVLINHIQAVRRIDGLQSAHIVFIPESNLAFEGIWIQQELHRSGLRDVCIMREDENRAGVRVNKEYKKIMAMSLNYKLLDQSIYFHRDFACIGEDNTIDKMQSEIIDQLRNYSRILVPSKDVHKAPDERYGGKTGHGFDDHAIALMLNLLMSRRFFSRTEAYSAWY